VLLVLCLPEYRYMPDGTRVQYIKRAVLLDCCKGSAHMHTVRVSITEVLYESPPALFYAMPKVGRSGRAAVCSAGVARLGYLVL